MSGFDRIKRPEQRLLERVEQPDGPASAADPDGRAALFSTAQEGEAPSTTLRLAVACSRCRATSPLDLKTALRAAFPLLLVAPCRSHPVFAVCPACRRRSWLRIGPAEALAR